MNSGHDPDNNLKTMEENKTDIFRRYGLREGMLGQALGILLRPGLSPQQHEEGQKMLNSLMRDYRLMPKGVSHGRWGLVPAIDILIRNGMIEPGPYWDSVISAQIREMLFLTYGATPVRMTAEDDFIAEGVMCVSAYRSLHDNLECLRLLERMVALVDEMELLLLTDPAPYTGSHSLTARHLHSMLHFLIFMAGLGAYPLKTRKMIAMLRGYCCVMEMPDDDDRALLHYLLGNSSLPDPKTEDVRFFHRLYGLDPGWGDGTLPDIKGLLKDIGMQATGLSDGETVIPLDSSVGLSRALYPELTVLMTLRVDSAERLRNYRACVSYLLRHTDVRIMVTEADMESRGDLFPGEMRVSYRFKKDPNPIFHRTRYMNLMFRECPTPYAALWDIDAIGDPGALAACVDALKDRGEVMAYPYNGRFWSVTDFFSEAFSRTLDMRMLADHPQPRHLMAGYHSVGGAFVVDVERYRTLGWENENFVGWGPEDMERYRRLEICGHRPLRIDADLYHLSHPRGINSSSSDPGLATSTKEEFLKVCAMMPGELREYIGTWKWTR